ncbi:hypothetical protein BT67DRAFT_451231 [Trichocladium antarcticum]|uniref:Uncharacterized protein n=1 Tax=Trichocladium antarcticum TaxID=1450529 RepID=A0AAN6UFN1_9PEZI|nr:hypothetical protein BT67DRAFT_451231 [Trichocladium antarcticum]
MMLDAENPTWRLNLVHLPPHIRRRIYLHIGVARFDRHPYTYYLDGRKESRRQMSEFDPPPAGNFAGLLRTCRTLYAETTTLLYSANRFVIFYSTQGSLEPLRALSQTALAALTSLKIILNESSCHHPTDSRGYPPSCCVGGRQWTAISHCARYHGEVHRRPLLDPSLDLHLHLTSAKLATQHMLSEWSDTAAYLSSHVGVARLDFSLYTDLITPSKEVTVSRDARGYQFSPPVCLLGHGGCPPYMHHGCALSECSLFIDSTPPDVSARQPSCFCRRRHGAFSFACNCWAPPTGLFLICRALCRDAQFVFFSGNRFVVHDFRPLWPWALPSEQRQPSPDTTGTMLRYYPYDRLVASQFLRDMIPIHCLPYLRFLEFVFPPYVPHGWPCSELATIRDWRDTVGWVRDKVNAPALTIRFAMVDDRGPPYGREEMSKEQGARQIIRGYTSILEVFKPLVREDGLAAIYVEAAHPWRWNKDGFRNLDRDSYRLRQAEQQMKEKAEEFVRGNGRPRLDSHSKTEPRKSGWQRWYDADFY